MKEHKQLVQLNEKLNKLMPRKTALQQKMQEFKSKYGTRNAKLTAAQLKAKEALKEKYKINNTKIAEKKAELKKMMTIVKKKGGGREGREGSKGTLHRGPSYIRNGSRPTGDPQTLGAVYGKKVGSPQSPPQSPPNSSQQPPQTQQQTSSPQSPQTSSQPQQQTQPKNTPKCPPNANKGLANKHLPIMVLTDSYKLGHPQMYPDGATRMVAYGEFRGPMSIDKKPIGDDRIVVMGLEYIIKNYINRTWCKEDLEEAKKFFNTHAPGSSRYQFPEKEFEAIINRNGGKIPITVTGLPDGSVVLPHTPIYKIVAEKQGDINFSKLITFFETILTMVWYPSCVATLSRNCKQIIEDAYLDTGLAEKYNKEGTLIVDSSIKWVEQSKGGGRKKIKMRGGDPTTYASTLAGAGGLDGTIKISMHDFGFRGATSVEQSVLGGMAHLLNFDGTDTMSAAYQALKEANMLDIKKQSIGVSIPATEHSVMTSFKTEQEAMRNMFTKYITPDKEVVGYDKDFRIFAMVMDSYDYTRALFKELPNAIREYDPKFIFGESTLHKNENEKGKEINKLEAEYKLYKVVLRPDSGEPVEVVLLGLVAACAIFGFKEYIVNNKTYLQCNNSGVIQGDGINVFTLKKILQQLTGTGEFETLNLATGLNITEETDKKIKDVTLKNYLAQIMDKADERFKNDDKLKINVADVLALLEKGAHFTPDCMAFGMGGGLIQKVNRDTMKFATKLCSSTQNGENVIVMKNPATDPGKRSIPGEMDVVKVAVDEKKTKIPFKVISMEDLNRQEQIGTTIKKEVETNKDTKMTLKYPINETNVNTNFMDKRKNVNKEWYALKAYMKAKKDYYKNLQSNANKKLSNVKKSVYRKYEMPTATADEYSKYFSHLQNASYDGTQKPHFSKKLNDMQQFYDPSIKQFVNKTSSGKKLRK